MKDWTAILPLLGVAIGWLLNQTTARRTERLADQRVLKEMLYALLELHRLLSIIAWLSAELPNLVIRVRQQLPEAPPPAYEAAIDELLINMVRPVMTSFFSQQLVALKDGYATGLAKLAAVDPISAHRLRGQEDTWHQLQEVGGAAQQAGIEHLNLTPDNAAKIQTVLRQHFEPEGLAQARNLVQEVIQELAGQLDRRTQRRVTETVGKVEEGREEIVNEWEGRMRQLMATVAEQGQAS